MGKSVNKVILVGNVGRDVEYSSPNGLPVAKLSLCTNDREKVNGEWKDAPQWHSIVFFDRLADIAREYAIKGSKIYIEGRLKTRSWVGKDDGVTRYRTDIIASEMVLLGEPNGKRYVQDEHSQEDSITNEDVPF